MSYEDVTFPKMHNETALFAELDEGTYPDAPPSLIEAAKSLAIACDTKPGVASLWDKYLQALAELRATNDIHIDPKDEFAAKILDLKEKLQS